MMTFIRSSLAIALADFKLKNEGSYLGIIWYLLNPILLFILLLLIFSNRFGNDIPRYPLYLMLGIVMFNFFIQCTNDAARALHANEFILKSVPHTLEAIIASIIIRTLLSHFFEMLVFSILMIYLDASLINLIWYPIILLLMTTFILGLSLIISVLTLFITDIDNLWQFFSRLLWFATPIFYQIGGQWKLLLFNLANPMFYYISSARELLVYGNIPEIWQILGMVAFSLLSLMIGSFFFEKMKYKAVEKV